MQQGLKCSKVGRRKMNKESFEVKEITGAQALTEENVSDKV